MRILYVANHRHEHETTMNNEELSTVTRAIMEVIRVPHLSLHFDQNNKHSNKEIHDVPFLRCDLQKVSLHEYEQFNVFQFENCFYGRRLSTYTMA